VPDMNGGCLMKYASLSHHMIGDGDLWYGMKVRKNGKLTVYAGNPPNTHDYHTIFTWSDDQVA